MSQLDPVKSRLRVTSGLLGLAIAGFGLIVVGSTAWISFSRVGDRKILQASEFSAIPARVNFDAPSLELSDLEGIRHSLDEYRGQVILVNLWATWCPPCVAEMPNLQRFYEKHRADGLLVIGIEDGDPPEEVNAFVAANGLTFPIWLDPTYQATERAFKTRTLPSSYVVDRNGKVRMMWFGPISQANLEKFLTPLIKE